MSDENRDAAGQFSSAEIPVGSEAAEIDAGYVPYKEGPAAPAAEDLTIEEAAKDLAENLADGRGTPEPEIRTYSPLDDLPDNTSFTTEQMTNIIADERNAKEKAAEAREIEETRREVDELRGEKPEAVEAKAEAPAEPARPGELDPEIEKALNNPKIKAALDHHISETEGVRQAYSQAVETANEFARASFMENFPEITALPLHQWADALGAMAQREPDRFNRAVNTLQRVVRSQEAAQQQRQQAEQQSRESFQNYTKAENARFESLVKGETKETMRALPNVIIEAIKEYGGDPKEFMQLAASNDFINSAITQRLLVDAGKYRMMQKAAKATATVAVPPVQRPGVSRSAAETNSDRSQVARSKIAAGKGEARDLASIIGNLRRG